MPSYWIVNLLNPTIVTGPGRYVTRGGEVVTVERTDRFRAFGHYQNGTREWWTLSGRTLPFTESPNDIVGPAPFVPVQPVKARLVDGRLWA